MKTHLEISKGPYGFNYNWTLILDNGKERKPFVLGQDVKVCRRLLQMEPSEVVKAIGTNKIETELGNKKITKFILKVLKENHLLTPAKIFKLESWALCVE